MFKSIIIVYFLFYNVLAQFYPTTNHFDLMKTVFGWNQIEFNFDGVLFRKDTAKRRGPGIIYFDEDVDETEQFFIQYNNVPVGFDVYKDKVFVTVPRRRYGIPSTLNVATTLSDNTKVPLNPYPGVDSVSSFVSVYRPRVDLQCNRLWVVDTGLLEVPGNRKQIKPPEIIIFDLKTDTEILRYQLKSSDLSNGTTSGLTSITVDVSDSCDDAYAYINDLATGGLIVFSLREKESWRFSHPTFAYDPGASNFKVGDQIIDWKDGIFSIALSDPDSAGVRKAYYHPLVATQEFSITTDILKNKNGDFKKNYKIEGVRGPWSQSGSHAYDSKSRTFFFANVAQDGVLCWNIDKALTAKNTAMIAQNHEQLSYISDLKVVDDNVWVLVNQMPKFIYSKLNTTEINFQILQANISGLIKGTVCEGRK